MKNQILYILLLISTVTFAQLDSFEVKVEGLGCPFCAYGLEKKFKELKGIKKIAIKMEEGLLSFRYPSEKNLTIQEVNTQVEKAGYTPVKASITRASGQEENSAIFISDISKKGDFIQFKTYGNCDMCKARIEKVVLEIKEVQSVEWNKNTKITKVKVTDVSMIDNIQKSIANAGHDTELYNTKTEVYDNLPPCCLYKRKKQ